MRLGTYAAAVIVVHNLAVLALILIRCPSHVHNLHHTFVTHGAFDFFADFLATELQTNKPQSA